MFEHQPLNLPNRYRGDSLVARQAYRIEPEFTFTIRRFNMNVRRLITLIGVKVKSK